MRFVTVNSLAAAAAAAPTLHSLYIQALYTSSKKYRRMPSHRAATMANGAPHCQKRMAAVTRVLTDLLFDLH